MDRTKCRREEGREALGRVNPKRTHHLQSVTVSQSVTHLAHPARKTKPDFVSS